MSDKVSLADIDGGEGGYFKKFSSFIHIIDINILYLYIECRLPLDMITKILSISKIGIYKRFNIVEAIVKLNYFKPKFSQVELIKLLQCILDDNSSGYILYLNAFSVQSIKKFYNVNIDGAYSLPNVLKYIEKLCNVSTCEEMEQVMLCQLKHLNKYNKHYLAEVHKEGLIVKIKQLETLLKYLKVIYNSQIKSSLVDKNVKLFFKE